MHLNHVKAIKSVLVLKQLTKVHFSISSRAFFSSTDDLVFPVYLSTPSMGYYLEIKY